MDIKNKQWIIIMVLSLIIGVGIGYFIFHRKPAPTPDPEIQIIENQEKIDSLNNIINAKNERIEFLLDSASRIKNIIVKKEIEKIQELPMSDNVVLLRENLERHGELFSPSDSLPGLVCSESLDTVAVLSGSNIKDVNSIVAKLDGEISVNKNLSEVIENQDEIIADKDSIIVRKDIILSAQEQKYMKEVNDLNKSIKIKNIELIAGGTVLGGLAIFFGIMAATK